MTPDDFNTLRNKAVADAKSGNIDSAISTIKEALAFCSNEEASILLTNISLLYYQRKEWDKALLYADQAMQAWPGSVKARFRAGMAQLRLGQPAAACTSFSAGLQFVPGHRHLSNALREAQSQLRREFTVRIHAVNSSRLQASIESATQMATMMEDGPVCGCAGQGDEVSRRLRDSNQPHQHSLRGKGWYDAHHQMQSPSQLVTEASSRAEVANILDIAPGAALADARAAYRRMVLAAHPDKGGSVEAFERVQQAYHLITAMSCSNSVDAARACAAARGSDFKSWRSYAFPEHTQAV